MCNPIIWQVRTDKLVSATGPSPAQVFFCLFFVLNVLFSCPLCQRILALVVPAVSLDCQHVDTQHGPPTLCSPMQDGEGQPAGHAVTTLPQAQGQPHSGLGYGFSALHKKNLNSLSREVLSHKLSLLLSLESSKRDFCPTLQVLGVQGSPGPDTEGGT